MEPLSTGGHLACAWSALPQQLIIVITTDPSSPASQGMSRGRFRSGPANSGLSFIQWWVTKAAENMVAGEKDAYIHRFLTERGTYTHEPILALKTFRRDLRPENVGGSCL